MTSELYAHCNLQVSEYKEEVEGKDYQACRFQINGNGVICRTAKITPKKTGQFVTFWKRNVEGIIEPFHETDIFDLFVINVKCEKHSGQFVFPKSLLIKKGLISSPKREGNRGFRVYPSWDMKKNKQAQSTQKWQLDYFVALNDSTTLDRIKGLYF